MKRILLFQLILLIFFSLTLFAQDFKKGKLIYANNFSTEADIKDWIMEGPGKIEFINKAMHMYSLNEEGHHVFWCPKDFPKSFIAEWNAQNFEPDAGLCIIFFGAKGLNNESIFDSSMPKRTTGVFTDYTKGAMNCYHISYYANAKDDPHRETANLRKNKGFNLVLTGQKGIPIESTLKHHVVLIKDEGHIQMFVDDNKIIDWQDDGVKYGKVIEDGKIGFRQMRWTNFSYDNFKVWEFKSNKN
jgi:hypothetical protein